MEIRETFITTAASGADPMAAILEMHESRDVQDFRQVVVNSLHVHASPQHDEREGNYLKAVAEQTAEAHEAMRKAGIQEEENDSDWTAHLIVSAVERERQKRAQLFDAKYRERVTAPRWDGVYIGGPRHIMTNPDLYPNLDLHILAVAPKFQEAETISATCDHFSNRSVKEIARRVMGHIIPPQIRAEHDLLEVAITNRKEVVAKHPLSTFFTGLLLR